MDMCLPNFDIYEGTIAPNCFKSHINFSRPDFFQKEKDFVRCLVLHRNIVSNGQSVRALKNLIFRPANVYGIV